MPFRIPAASIRSRRLATAAIVALAVTAGAANAQTVNFESLAYGGACQWGGGAALDAYAGFHWGGIIPLDLNNLQNTCGRNYSTGYVNLLPEKIGEVVGLGYGNAWLSRNKAFVLKSFVGGAGWINTTTLTLSYYLNTVLQGSSTVTFDVFQTGNTTFSGLFAGEADYIGFSANFSGTDYFNSAAESCLGQTNCTQHPYQTYFLDNLVFEDAPVVATAVTPEPATVGLLGIGMLLIGAAAKRRRQR